MSDPLCLRGSSSSPGCKANELQSRITELESALAERDAEIQSWKDRLDVAERLCAECGKGFLDTDWAMERKELESALALTDDSLRTSMNATVELRALVAEKERELAALEHEVMQGAANYEHACFVIAEKEKELAAWRNGSTAKVFDSAHPPKEQS